MPSIFLFHQILYFGISLSHSLSLSLSPIRLVDTRAPSCALPLSRVHTAVQICVQVCLCTYIYIFLSLSLSVSVCVASRFVCWPVSLSVRVHVRISVHFFPRLHSFFLISSREISSGRILSDDERQESRACREKEAPVPADTEKNRRDSREPEAIVAGILSRPPPESGRCRIRTNELPSARASLFETLLAASFRSTTSRGTRERRTRDGNATDLAPRDAGTRFSVFFRWRCRVLLAPPPRDVAATPWNDV